MWMLFDNVTMNERMVHDGIQKCNACTCIANYADVLGTLLFI